MRDANGQALSYVYYENEPGRRSAAKLLSKDEARRVASNIAKLPDLLRKGATPLSPWSVEELDALLCQIESRIKKTPAFRAGVFLYANKSGARGVGGMGESARLVVTLGRRQF